MSALWVVVLRGYSSVSPKPRLGFNCDLYSLLIMESATGWPSVCQGQGILEFVREILNFVESQGNLRKVGKFKKIHVS